MLLRRLLPTAALAGALVLSLSACQENTSQESSPPVSAGDSLALDTSGTAPGFGAPPDTAGGMNAGTTGRAGRNASLPPGVDTTGSGPATIPQGRYTTTGSGLKYFDLRPGSGPSPDSTSRVRVHYTGWLQSNGQKFDSSRDRGQPAAFGLNQVIAGWTEGLQSMQVRGTRQLVIPPRLAYGQRGAGNAIPPGATLVFEVELLGIEGQRGGGGGGGMQ